MFPDPRSADKDGFVAYGGNLNCDTLLNAYNLGIFPWYNEDPILWWSPDPRFILEMDDFKIRKSLKRVLKNHDFTIKFNTNFKNTILRCQSVHKKNHKETWISDDIIEAYCNLHKKGFALSVETYLDNVQVGGLYGVIVAKVFCGESMFSTVSNASKVAFCYLMDKLKKENFDFVDCQIYSELFYNFGAREIQREEFLKKLENSKKGCL